MQSESAPRPSSCEDGSSFSIAAYVYHMCNSSHRQERDGRRVSGVVFYLSIWHLVRDVRFWLFGIAEPHYDRGVRRRWESREWRDRV
jgi:hypothetical protein